MENKYDEIKEKHQQRVNNFPMMFAFSQEQLYDGMKKLGLKSTDTDKIYDMGMGCFIKKTTFSINPKDLCHQLSEVFAAMGAICSMI